MLEAGTQIGPITPDVAAETKAKAFETGLATYRGATPVVVSTPEDFQREGLKLAQVKVVLKNIETERKALVDPLNAVVKRINALMKGTAEQYEDAARWIEKPMADFKREELRQKQDADRLVAAERLRVKAEEDAKVAAELAAVAAARQVQVDAAVALSSAAASGDLFAELLAADAATEAQAQADEAEALAATAIRDSRRAVDAVGKSDARLTTAIGIRSQEKWTFKIVNPSLIPRVFLIPDTTTIGQHARHNKENSDIPGVEFFPEISFGMR